ncbi:MAG: family 1 glycosylhydrolase [Candidatus Saccharimonadales bacterium]
MVQKYTFPKRFLWGAATSAHQVEGGNHNQWSVSELEHAKSRAKQAEYKLNYLPDWDEIKRDATRPSNYVSGKAVDHYHRYEQDFDILTKLHMNAFRFSIEWSRIEPEEGKWDMTEIEHYRAYLSALQERGVEPLVTLFHWSMPVWFAEKGGFEKRANIHYFVRFAEKVLHEYESSIRLVCTFNEPEVYVGQGWMSEGEWPPHKHSNYLLSAWTYYNITVAHNRVVRSGRRISRRFKFSVSKNCSHHYAGDDKWSSKLVVWAFRYVGDYWFLSRIRRHMDWLGLNYYFANRYENGRIRNLNERISDLGWEMRPGDVQFVLERLYKKYKKPIIITESGVADRGDRYRRWWIAHTIDAIYKAMKNGAKIEGYLHWSLLDNFEWAYGKWPRFGLVEVDYTTLARTPRPSALWFGKVIKKLRGV